MTKTTDFKCETTKKSIENQREWAKNKNHNQKIQNPFLAGLFTIGATISFENYLNCHFPMILTNLLIKNLVIVVSSDINAVFFF